MPEIKRAAEATWIGNLTGGRGMMSTESGTLSQVEYTFKTRFGDQRGTNPEELIAAAHAGCFSMAFAHTLAEQGHEPKRITTKATCALVETNEGFNIAEMHLHVRAKAGDLDEITFKRIAEDAHKRCPVSNLLRHGLTIELDVSLE